MELLRRSYDFCRRGVLEWTLGECARDGDLLPYGYGITEREGLDLQCIDVATHTVKGLQALAGMAGTLGDEDVATRCQALAAAARARLEEAFWIEDEGLYGDMVATPREMAPRLQRWLSEGEGVYYGSAREADVTAELTRLLRQAESAGAEQDRKRPWLLKYWIVLCPLEAGLTAAERALRSLARLESPEFSGRWGVYISGLDRMHAMSISTGALAVAEATYGRVDRALDYVRKLTDTLDLHMPGAISELSPDSGCFVQAWSGYAVAWPLVAHVFGVRPEAHRRRLTLAPRFPTSWPEARLGNVRIGSATFDFHWDGKTLMARGSEPGWTVSDEP
jgi:glycogen debranching enzyme